MGFGCSYFSAACSKNSHVRHDESFFLAAFFSRMGKEEPADCSRNRSARNLCLSHRPAIRPKGRRARLFNGHDNLAYTSHPMVHSWHKYFFSGHHERREKARPLCGCWRLCRLPCAPSIWANALSVSSTCSRMRNSLRDLHVHTALCHGAEKLLYRFDSRLGKARDCRRRETGGNLGLF